jgi:hypothetical protein
MALDETTLRRGRRTALRAEFIEQARKLALLGATDAQLGEFFGVDDHTINRWRKQQPEFRQSLKEGGTEADARGAGSLYKRAADFSHEAEKILGAAASGKHPLCEFGEQFAPDVTVCISWLKNRRPNRSPDRMLDERTGKDGKPIKAAHEGLELSDLEIARRICFILRRADPANRDGDAPGYRTTVASSATSTRNT